MGRRFPKKLEIRLLTESTKKPHMYYHLISGMDLQLKTQNEIHRFFSDNYGYDFVSLESNHLHNSTKDFMNRVNYYYFFQNHIGRNINSFASKLQRKHLIIQRKLYVCRTKKLHFSFQKGANWFSLTHKTATHIVNEYKKYKKYKRVFRYSFCADEVFLQTILILCK